MAPWQSGYAADCKSVDLGSTPGGASILFLVSIQTSDQSVVRIRLFVVILR
ncbi:hypothetical protein THOD03_360021 [Vibrio harveyi]|nr:hypothetical protein TH15OA1_540020 [Vibrio harveyi]CAH1568110.1 hypothetical protein THOD03_360021 [Vibrio harveyi]